MTDTTTADDLAAWELIEAHRLCVCPMSDADGFNAFQLHVGADAGMGTTPAAAVKDWAERAGVKWKTPKVVQRWACEVDGEIGAAYTTPENAAVVADIGKCGTVVPCEVVIRETKGV